MTLKPQVDFKYLSISFLSDGKMERDGSTNRGLVLSNEGVVSLSVDEEKVESKGKAL